MSITLTPQLDDTLTTRDGETAVDARSLHAFLENGDKFATWFSERVQQYGFVEGIDFESFSANTEKPQIGRPSKDYAVTIDMAKELCMVERNAKGKEARLYFISMEKKAKALSATVPQSLPEALRLAADLAEKIEKQDAKILELAPKAQFHDKVADASNCHTMEQVAKLIGTGRTRLFNFCYEHGILMRRKRTPYQQFIERGYFRLIETPYTHPHTGENMLSTKPVVTGKGVTWLAEQFGKTV